MFHITKQLTFASAHQLNLPYVSKCNNLHGHEWKVKVTLSAQNLNANGMVADFAVIKRVIVDTFDHKVLNDVTKQLFSEQGCLYDVPGFTDVMIKYPTAETLCLIIRELLELNFGHFCCVTRVEVIESEGSSAVWEM